MEDIFRKIHDGQRLIRRIDKRVCLVVVWMPAARLNANLLRFDMGKRPRERLRLAKEEALQPSAANRSEEFRLFLGLYASLLGQLVLHLAVHATDIFHSQHILYIILQMNREFPEITAVKKAQNLCIGK